MGNNESQKHSSKSSKLSKLHQILSPFFLPLVFLVTGISIGFALCFFLKTLDFNFQAKLFSLSSSSSVDSISSQLLRNNGSLIMHNMDDDELFRQALLVGKNEKSYGYDKYLTRVAFMFLTRGPLPLAPLWENFFEGAGDKELFSIYIHADPLYKGSVPQKSVFHGRRIPSKPVEWAGATMIDAMRRLLANALLDPTNQRFVLLSEACIPLFNFTTTYSYLTNTNLSNIASYDEPGKGGRGRYNSKMFPTLSISQWRKGSQWFDANRKAALEIVSDNKYYPIFLEYCPHPCFRDEHYIPTLVNIAVPYRNSNRSITWVDWSKPGPHPGRFGRENITDEFLNQIKFGGNCTYNGVNTSMCFMFARKFSPNALQPLMKILSL